MIKWDRPCYKCSSHFCDLSCEEALAQPEQEPVGYGMWDTMVGYGGRMMMVRLDKGQDGCTVPLYTTPPQRKPLTVDEVWQNDQLMALNAELGCGMDLLMEVVEAVEAAHNIKE